MRGIDGAGHTTEHFYINHFVTVARRSDSGLKTEACLLSTWTYIWNAPFLGTLPGPPALAQRHSGKSFLRGIDDARHTTESI